MKIRNLLFLLFIFILGCSSQDSVTETNTLKVGLSAEYPPFEFQDLGQTVGFDVDLANALALQLGKKVQIQDMAFHNLIPALQNGKIDMVISGMTVTPERLKNVDFSHNYYQTSLAILYLKNQPKPKLTDLSQKKFGAQMGSIMERWAKNQVPSGQSTQVVALDTNPSLIEKLKHQQIDYVVVETTQAIEFCKVNPMLAFMTVGVSQEGYGIAFAKGSDLLPQINQALATLKANGVLQQIQDKWISHE